MGRIFYFLVLLTLGSSSRGFQISNSHFVTDYRIHDVKPKLTSPTISLQSTSALWASSKNDNSSPNVWEQVIENPKRSILFSLLMGLCGALLGPFLDAYHSAFGVLKYDDPITAVLWGSEQFPGLTTAWWVP